MALTPAERFELAVARWRLGVGETRDIVEAAIDLVGAGVDAPPVLRLAESTVPGASLDSREFERLVAAAAVALALPAPSPDRTLLVAARDTLERIADGRVEPYEGASFLWERISNAYDDGVLFWGAFIGAADEIADESPHRAECERDIVAHARKILAAWGPRPALPDRLP